MIKGCDSAIEKMETSRQTLATICSQYCIDREKEGKPLKVYIQGIVSFLLYYSSHSIMPEEFICHFFEPAKLCHGFQELQSTQRGVKNGLKSDLIFCIRFVILVLSCQ